MLSMSKMSVSLLLLLLCACSAVQAQTLPSPSAVLMRTQPAPAATRDVRPVEQATATTSTCSLNSDSPAARHTVSADVDFAAHTVAVRQQIAYTNPETAPLTDLVLNVEVNYWEQVFVLASVMVDDIPLTFALENERLTLVLPQPLWPGCTLRVTLDYTLAVPPLGTGRAAYKGYFSYSPRQLNLGHWLATLAVRQNGTWITHDLSLIGEQTLLDIADWDVTFTLYNAADTLQVAAPGEMTRTDTNRWHFVHTRARDFSASFSDAFKIDLQQTPSGVFVELYSFPDAQIPAADGHIIDSAAQAVSSATRALAMYEDLFGLYPHARVLVVQGDFPDGMEFDGLVFVSSSWFTAYTGDPASYLTLITVHEVAHQWWYALVGNDAALNPYLDEALATYSEYIFIEEYYPQLRQWWWEFRVDPFAPAGYVDSTVYQFASVREYINAVYLRGVRMLHQLRQDLGTQAFFEWLRAYAASADGQIATPARFWSLLTPEQQTATQSTRDEFLSVPQIAQMP